MAEHVGFCTMYSRTCTLLLAMLPMIHVESQGLYSSLQCTILKLPVIVKDPKIKLELRVYALAIYLTCALYSIHAFSWRRVAVDRESVANSYTAMWNS